MNKRQEGNGPVVVTPITEVSLQGSAIFQELNKDAADNRIWLKRDDLLPFSMGGNKVRIAWEFVRDMEERGCNAMLIYGDTRSNLCRILAGLCHKKGIPVRMIATEAEGEAHHEASFNEKLVRLFNVPLRITSKDRIADCVDEEMQAFSKQGLTPYYIYGNRFGTGNEGTAARAYAKAYREILRQENEMGIRFDLIVVPYGTGATQGGLIAGAIECGDADRIVGISISSRPAQRAEEVLLKSAASYLKEKNIAADEELIRERVHLETKYNCGGYGVIDDDVRAVMRDMFLTNGVAMAPEYSAKAFAGMCRYLRENGIRGKNLLFLHTGGMPLFFDELARQLQ